MTLTLHLPPATEARLIAAASASGKEVPAFVVEVVEAHLAIETRSLRSILGPIHDEFRAGGLSEAKLDALFAGELKAVRADRSGA